MQFLYGFKTSVITARLSAGSQYALCCTIFLQLREDDSIWRPQTSAATDEDEGDNPLGESAEFEAGEVWRDQMRTHLYNNHDNF